MGTGKVKLKANGSVCVKKAVNIQGFDERSKGIDSFTAVNLGAEGHGGVTTAVAFLVIRALLAEGVEWTACWNKMPEHLSV